MPYTGEHAARIVEPSEFEKFRRQNNKFGRGVHVIFGIRAGGGSEVQAIRFDSTLFSIEEARKWLRDHDYKSISVEPALPENKEEKEQAEGEKGMDADLKQRALAVEINPTLGNMQELEGGLLVKGVKLLAAGTWTDSTQRTPCRYTPKALEKFAGNWTDLGLWTRHLGGMPRDITEKVGEIRTPRFHEDAVVGDLFYHGRTTRSRDTIEMVKHNLANYVSVEMRTRDRWLTNEKLFEAEEIAFDGVAVVNRGACTVCTIRSNESDDTGKPDETPVIDTHELMIRHEGGKWILYTSDGSKKLGEFDTEEAAKKRLKEIEFFKHEKEAEVPAPKEPKQEKGMDDTEKKLFEDLAGKVKVLEEAQKATEAGKATMAKELEQTKAELEKLKNIPAPKTGTGPEKTLEEPTFMVSVDRKAGIVGGE